MLKTPKHIHRFLFSSPAHFVGEVETNDYLLTPAFPSFTKGMEVFYVDGPGRRSFFTVTLRIEEEGVADKKKSTVRHSYDSVAETLAGLLSAFYGKLITNQGYLDFGDISAVPRLDFNHTVDYALFPFNSRPRRATGLKDLNLAHSSHFISAFISNSSAEAWGPISNGAAFYQQALSLFSERPHLSFALLLSALECLLPLGKYDEGDLYDPKLLADLAVIEAKVEGGAEIVKRLKSRMFQIRRKCAMFIRTRLDEQFYSTTESDPNYPKLKPSDTEKRIQAAYDLRSRFMHTGKSHGVWVDTFKHVGAEFIIGDPVIADSELKKLIVDSVTLSGLERVVQYCLFRSITDFSKIENSSSDSVVRASLPPKEDAVVKMRLAKS
jgi:hypothetical protein